MAVYVHLSVVENVGCKATGNGFKSASNKLAAVLPTAELVFKQESTYCGKRKEETVKSSVLGSFTVYFKI